MKKLFFVVALVALLCSPAVQAAETVSAGQTFSVAADHDGVDTTSFRLYVNGVMTETKSVSELQGGVIVFARPAAQAGSTYVFYVEAVGPGGAGASTTLTVTVPSAPPPAPTAPTSPRNLRIMGVPSTAPNGIDGK